MEFPHVLVKRVVLFYLLHHRMFTLLSCELQSGDLGDGVERKDQCLPNVLGVIVRQLVKLSIPYIELEVVAGRGCVDILVSVGHKDRLREFRPLHPLIKVEAYPTFFQTYFYQLILF